MIITTIAAKAGSSYFYTLYYFSPIHRQYWIFRTSRARAAADQQSFVPICRQYREFLNFGDYPRTLPCPQYVYPGLKCFCPFKGLLSALWEGLHVTTGRGGIHLNFEDKTAIGRERQ